MKPTLLILSLSCLLAGCAHPLEVVVDQRHQARIEASNANHHVGQGAADGLGSYIAQNRGAEPKSTQP